MGLRLFFLTNFPGALFIQGAKFIPDSRVHTWYKAQKVQKYALNSQLQALQILTNDDEVEN